MVRYKASSPRAVGSLHSCRLGTFSHRSTTFPHHDHFIPSYSSTNQNHEMATTTHPEFNEHTEGIDVAKAFADGIRGKTVVITGVNRGGIGFGTAEAFVRLAQKPQLCLLQILTG
jgi:hypothetical protein